MGSELNTEEKLQSLLEQLTHSDANQRLKAVETLLRIQREQGIPGEFLQRAISALQQTTTEESGEVRGKLDMALIQLKQILAQPLFQALDKFGSKDTQNGVLSPQAADVLHQLVELDSRVVVRDLINRWVTWIATGQRHLLVDAIAEQLRTNPDAVLPLVEHFAKELELTDPLKIAIIRQTIAPAFLPAIKHFIPDLLDEDLGEVNPEDLPKLAIKLVEQVDEFLKSNGCDQIQLIQPLSSQSK